MSIGASLLSEFDSEMENTRKILAPVPEGKWDWKPHSKSMSLGALTSHMASMPSWGATTMTTDDLAMNPGDYTPYVPSSTADLLATFEKSKAEYRELLSNASDKSFARMWSMTWGGKKVIEMPRIAVVRSMVMDHLIHHRGQLTVYLRLLEIPVPGTYGPSADEMGGGQ